MQKQSKSNGTSTSTITITHNDQQSESTGAEVSSSAPLILKQDQQQHEHHPQQHGILRLALCATGICVCYLYYGLLQERLFTGEQLLGATFVLVTQCVTNTIVAVLWQQVERKLLLPSATPSTRSTSASTISSLTLQLPLHHWLLLFTSACYVGAMGCSNEAIQYVSYPVAVLAKSCKLIPTMLVGQTVEGKLYSRKEWMAALLISTGIGIFHWSRMDSIHKHKQQTHTTAGTRDDQDAQADDHATYGMLLLLISLVMDGVLSSCQNFLKRTTTRSRLSSSSTATSTTTTTLLPSYRPPNAVETMLFVNLYALVFLIPVAMYTGQWQHGLDALFSAKDNNNTGTGTSNALLHKIFILNATVAAGQVFIFLTITWYTPVITTTITTTRKFVTILLSVWAFGHSFTVMQWTAIALVFTGLYLVIMLQRQQKPSGTRPKAKTD